MHLSLPHGHPHGSPHDHDHDEGHDHSHLHDDRRPNGRPARLGRSLSALLLIAGGGVLLARTLFFVDETEYVYVTQFGAPVRLYTEAGLGVKWPFQSLWRFDRRLQLYEPAPRELLTEDKENLNFDWYVCWRIPSRSLVVRSLGRGGELASEGVIRQELETYVRRFLQSIGSPEAAENRLEERIQAALAAEIGRTRLGNIVSLKPAELRIESIFERVTQAVRGIAADQFGIEVVDIRLKRVGYPESVKPAVYAEIRSERERVAVQYRAEGTSEKTKIESLAALERDQLIAQAKRDAKRIRGEGEAKAMEILNAAHTKNPEFYELLKTLETYRSILDDQTTVILAADSPLLKLLTLGVPALARPTAPPSASPPVTGKPVGTSPARSSAEPPDPHSAAARGAGS